MDIFKTECFLRLSAILVLLLVVVLVRLDAETKIMFVAWKATYRELNALVVLVGVDAAAAGYNLLQLLRSLTLPPHEGNLMVSYQTLAWICFLLDQVTVYVVFATNASGFTASMLAVTGSDNFQWMQLCDKYAKFCHQMGAAIFLGFVASFLLVMISFISAFNLFRLYAPNRFFCLKAK